MLPNYDIRCHSSFRLVYNQLNNFHQFCLKPYIYFIIKICGFYWKQIHSQQSAYLAYIVTLCTECWDPRSSLHQDGGCVVPPAGPSVATQSWSPVRPPSTPLPGLYSLFGLFGASSVDDCSVPVIFCNAMLPVLNTNTNYKFAHT